MPTRHDLHHWWHQAGHILHTTTFRWPVVAEDQASVTLRAAELTMLLDGIDWQQARRSRRYHRPATG